MTVTVLVNSQQYNPFNISSFHIIFWKIRNSPKQAPVENILELICFKKVPTARKKNEDGLNTGEFYVDWQKV